MAKIIKIHEDKCDGCGLCISACHEGAIALVDGVAKLVNEDYCDGLGDCLPACPREAIELIEKDSTPKTQAGLPPLPCGCPGSESKVLKREPVNARIEAISAQSMLNQWPVQIKLVPVMAEYFDNANLLIAADCSAYAYADFHNKFIKNHVTIIGCPKLDMVDYQDKLTLIIKNNNIKSLTVVRMEVPCCGGIEHAAVEALKASGKFIPWQVVTISTKGEIR